MNVKALPGTSHPTYSVEELKAAVEALLVGQFSVAGRVDQGVDLAPLVRIRAASAGAGASTVALAFADACDGAGIRTRVLDAAHPGWSGLAAATAQDLDVDAGWRRGRRGARIWVDRVATPVADVGAVPPPRTVSDVDLTVLDVAWTVRELERDAAWMTSAEADVDMVVTRATATALSQAEAMLARLRSAESGELIVVVVGAGRWLSPTLAFASPILVDMQRGGRVIFAPVLSAKAYAGPSPEPLPRQLRAVGVRLLEVVMARTRVGRAIGR
jgi:hypothetical protein